MAIMIDNQKILTQIIDYLNHNFGLTPKSMVKHRGYYLWDFGDDSTIHIEFKEIKNWKFGIWILTPDDPENDVIVIEFFGNKKNWIDKFKPTCSKISSEVKITAKDIDDPDDYLWDLFYSIQQDLNGLKRHRFLWEYFLDSDGEDHFVRWLIDEIWWGTIDPKLQKFYQKYVLLPIAKLTAKLWKLRFHKYIYNCYVEDTSEKYYFEPCRLYVTYTDDENASKFVSDKIQLYSPLFALLNKTRDWIGSVRVEHIHKDSNRKLYYINTYYSL